MYDGWTQWILLTLVILFGFLFFFIQTVNDKFCVEIKIWIMFTLLCLLCKCPLYIITFGAYWSIYWSEWCIGGVLSITLFRMFSWGNYSGVAVYPQSHNNSTFLFCSVVAKKGIKMNTFIILKSCNVMK